MNYIYRSYWFNDDLTRMIAVKTNIATSIMNEQDFLESKSSLARRHEW